MAEAEKKAGLLAMILFIVGVFSYGVHYTVKNHKLDTNAKFAEELADSSYKRWQDNIAEAFNESKSPIPVAAPKYVVNLDRAPIERWQQIAANYDGPKLSRWLNETLIKVLADPTEVTKFIDVLKIYANLLFGDEVADEMRGLSKGLQIDFSDVLLINIVYDLTAYNTSKTRFHTKNRAATSILVETLGEDLFHGRNYDYYGAQFLRNLVIDVDFQRNEETLYKGTTIIGYVGLITGERPNAFTITANQRDTDYEPKNSEKTLRESELNAIALRKLLEEATTYEEALSMLQTKPLVAPMYYILGGVKSGQGVIIVRDPKVVVDIIPMRNQSNHPWFVIQTNNEPSEVVQDTHHKRTDGILYMKEVGQQNIDQNNLFQVLSRQPLMSNETIFTTMMSATGGCFYQTMIRYDAK